MPHMKPHLTALEAAYQLHYYLWFKTYYLQPLLASADRQRLAETVIADTCSRNHYSLLESDSDSTHLRLLVSLQPTHTVSKVVKLLKGNLQYQFGKAFDGEKLLGRGYFARTAGRVDLERARNYVSSQITHHGYRGEWTKPLKFRNSAFRSPAFSFEHCCTILNYHLVCATNARIPIFDEAIGPKLFDYIMAIGKKHQFVVDRIGLLPDHMHMIIEGVPSVSVEEYALTIMNNTQYWMTKNYAGVLKETGAWDVWQPSYYAGTVGEFTSAQVGKFLRGES
jgi:putative transposase